MIQEYLAFGTFILALLFAVVSLSRFVVTQIRGQEKTRCSSQCNCKPSGIEHLKTKKIRPGGDFYQSV